jgi:hypothetical protein
LRQHCDIELDYITILWPHATLFFRAKGIGDDEEDYALPIYAERIPANTVAAAPEVIMGISNKAVLAALLGLVAAGASEARAAYVIDLDQVGSNVVATGSGSFNVSGVDLIGFNFPFHVGIDSSSGYLAIGNLDGFGGDVGLGYSPISGPSSFGSGLFTAPTSTTGYIAGINGSDCIVFVPWGYGWYVPTLSGTATWDNTTLAALGVSRGSYVWTWNGDSFTLNVSGGAPEPTTWALTLLGFAGLAYAGYRRARAGHETLAK